MEPKVLRFKRLTLFYLGGGANFALPSDLFQIIIFVFEIEP